MSTLRRFFHLVVLIAVLGLTFTVAAPAHASGTIITVDTTTDALGDGHCSFQEAMAAAISNTSQDSGVCPAGVNGGPDTIDFNISGSGIQTITLASAINITDAVIIDGTSQSGYSGAPLIRIDGGGSALYGLVFNPASEGSTLKGVMVTHFTTSEVVIQTGNSTSFITLSGNYIGTDGSHALGGTNGVAILGGDYAMIGGLTTADRNVIAGNTYDVYIAGSTSTATNNTVRGNYIGLNAGGTAKVTSSYGVVFANSGAGATDNTVQFNAISGHLEYQVWIQDSTDDNNTIQGNYIGTDAGGLSSPFGSFAGIQIDAGDGNIIGGNGDIGKRNLIAGNLDYEIYIQGGTGTVIADNVLGMNSSGTARLDNPTTGIYIGNSADAQIARNWIGVGSIGLFLNGTATLDANSSSNCLLGNIPYGAVNNTGASVTFDNNWWGSDTGPNNSTSNPGGLGTPVGDNVVYTPWATSAQAICSAHVNLAVASLDFGDQLVGSSQTQLLTVYNNGTVPLNLSSLGSPAAPFSVAIGPATTCSTSAPVAAGTSCQIAVKFRPNSVGLFSSTLSLTSNAVPSTTDLPLSGTGITGTQLLKDPSFEADANHDSKPDNFTFANFNAATDQRDCTVHKAGSCSLKFTGNGLTKTASQSLLKSGVAGDGFTFALWSKAAGVPSGSVYRLQVKFYNGSTLLSTKTRNFTVGTHGFAKVSGAFTAPSAYTKVVYRIVFKAASGTAWFDIASLNSTP